MVVGSCWLPLSLQAKPLTLFGNWKGYFQGSDDDTVTDGFVQFRQLYNASWTPLITEKMSFTANMGYNRNWFADMGTREIINPSLQYSIRNDLFNFGLNGNVVQNNISYREDSNTSSWNSDLSSSWTNYLWPRLSLRMGQRFETNDRVTTENDSTYSFVGSSVTWEIYKFKLFYDYNRSTKDEDYTDGSSTDDIEGHLAKLEYYDNFWNNRVRMNFSQLVYDNKLEFSVSGNNSLLQVPVRSAYSGVDVTPSAGVLPLNPALIDGNRISTATTIQLQQPVNLALRTGFNSVDHLYVYTTRDDKLLVANTDAVTWDLYTSMDGVSWRLVSANVSSSFNTTEFRFEVLTGTVRAEYMKLVVTGWLPALNIDITEVEAYMVPTVDSSGNYDRQSRNYKTEFSLGVDPLQDTRFNYTFSWDRNNNTGTVESEVQQMIQSARLNWDYSRYFAPSAGFSSITNKNDTPGAIDTDTRTYDLQVHSTPIPTVDLGFTYAWSEYYEDAERNRTNNNINLSALAALYPDLSAEMTVGYNQTKSDITKAENAGMYINFIMRSQLRKTLNVDLQTSYSFSNSDLVISPDGHLGHGTTVFDNTSSEGGETILTINWRPSDILSFSLRGYTIYDGEEENQYGGYFNANYLVFRTSKTNFTLTYWLNTASNRDTVNNFGLVWGWDISKYFTLNTSGNYVISEVENSWNFYSQLTAKF